MNVEDLMGVGIVGLLEAVNRYKEGKGSSLSTFVKYRIKGAMLDELNANSTVSKSQKKKLDIIKKTCQEIKKVSGQMPEDEEIAERLELTLDEYYGIIQGSQVVSILSIEEFSERNGNGEEIHLAEIIPDDSSDSPLRKLEERDKKQWLANIIDELPKKEKLILSLYYWDELTMKEIAGVMNMSEGRICQLHNKALIWLRARMETEKSIKEFL